MGSCPERTTSKPFRTVVGSFCTDKFGPAGTVSNLTIRKDHSSMVGTSSLPPEQSFKVYFVNLYGGVWRHGGSGKLVSKIRGRYESRRGKEF